MNVANCVDDVDAGEKHLGPSRVAQKQRLVLRALERHILDEMNAVLSTDPAHAHYLGFAICESVTAKTPFNQRYGNCHAKQIAYAP